MWVTCRDEAVDPHIATLPNPECTVLGLQIMGRVPAGVHNHHPVIIIIIIIITLSSS